MPPTAYQPIFELTRGDTVESIHFGALAVVDSSGRLVGSLGDPQVVTYLRSTAKPFQALPFIERGGPAHFGLTQKEIALMCASHSGTDEHVSTVLGIQAKTGVTEADLMCGVHPIFHAPTLEAMRQRGEQPTPNRHNCSGKHTGMLASAVMQGFPKAGYLELQHPIQEEILQAFAEMCNLPRDQVAIGVDGCSAPNFAVPLLNTALAFARLCDPQAGGVAPAARAAACRTITAAMTAFPEMVGGPDSFDTHLMQAARGQIIAKGGAEGYQGLGLLPGALRPGSPALGIAFKISDGDPRGRARSGVALEILRQLGALTPAQMQALSQFGPQVPVLNWRKIEVGQGRPCFQLDGS